jgi:hypothetical protein
MDFERKFDHDFKERLYAHEVPPPPHVWHGVQRTLAKRRRKLLIWWFFGLAGFLSGVGYWIWSGSLMSSDTPGSVQQVEAPIAGMEGEPNLPGAYKRTTEADTFMSVFPSTEDLGNKLFSDRLSAFSRSEVVSIGALDSPEEDFGAVVVPVQLPRLTSGRSIFQNTLAPASNLPTVSQINLRDLILEHQDLDRPHTGRCYDFGKNPQAWMLDLYVGPSLVFKQLLESNSEYSDYREDRFMTEREDWAMHAGMRATLLFDKNFLVRTGIHYDHVSELFEYVDSNSIMIDYRDIITWVGGQQVITRDTIGIRYGDNYFKVYNRYRMLELPVQLGIELRRGRFGMNVQAGVSVNIQFWKRGAILSTDGQPQYFTPGLPSSENIFKSRTSLSGLVGVRCFYHLTPTLRLFGEPFVRKMVQPINLETHPVNQRYTISGVSFGVTKIIH